MLASVNTLPRYLKLIFIEFSVCAAQMFSWGNLSPLDLSGRKKRYSALAIKIISIC